MPRKDIASDDPRVLFGRRLSMLRRQQHVSQEQLALDIGMARSYLSGVERGQRNIALLNICRLAAALGLRPSELLDFGSVPPAERENETV